MRALWQVSWVIPKMSGTPRMFWCSFHSSPIWAVFVDQSREKRILLCPLCPGLGLRAYFGAQGKPGAVLSSPGSLWCAWSRRAFVRIGECAWLLGNWKLPLPYEGDRPETLMLQDPSLTVKNSRGKRLFPCGSPLISPLIASQVWKCMGDPTLKSRAHSSAGVHLVGSQEGSPCERHGEIL